MTIEVLDLFSAAAGGWSLGMHRAGYKTVAACEVIDWRRVLYAQNNPGVLIYDDVRTLTVDRLRRDLGRLPGIIVGSPPCQDISSANTTGKGVDGPRSGLFFEAVRLIEECRPRWFALENSANLRTRGADRVLAALETVGYACWTFVVGAGDVGANHERKRSWIIGFDIAQLADANSGFLRNEPGRGGGESRRSASFATVDAGDASNNGWTEGRSRGRSLATEGLPIETCGHADAVSQRRNARNGQSSAVEWEKCLDDAFDATRLGHDGGRPWRHGPDGNGSPSVASGIRDAAHADQAGQADGCMVPGLRQEEIADDGCRDERRIDVIEADGEGQPHGAEHAEMGRSAGAGDLVGEPWADWNGGLAASLRLDDGLSAWLAQSRIMVGGVRGTSGASLVVEAFGDAVLPQIPEAIGRAIWRVEQQLLLRVSP